MWPWPLWAQLPIQKCFGAVEAESKSVPDCRSVGAVVRLVISYQRVAVRRVEAELATPVASTAMLCAVQRLPFLSVAEWRRSSSASSVRVVPFEGTAIG